MQTNFGSARTARNLSLTAFALLCCALWLYLSKFLSQFLLNVPFWDDYESLLLLSARWSAAGSGPGKLSLLFEPHNEHFFVFGRLAAAVLVSLTGTIDFRLISIFNFLAIPPVVALLYLLFNPRCAPALKPLGALPLVFLLQPLYFEAVISPTTGLNLLWLFPPALLAFYFLRFDGVSSSIAAMAFGVIAIFTNGAGVLVGPLLAACIFIARRPDWKRRLLIVAGGWLVIVPISMSILMRHSDLGSAAGHFEPIRALTYALAFIGSNLAFQDLTAAVVIGLVLLSLLALLLIDRERFGNIELLGVLLFLYAAALANSYSRSSSPLEAALSSRYQLVSALIVIVTFLLLLERLAAPRLFRGSAAALGFAAGVFLYLSYPFSEPIIRQYRSFIVYPTLEWASNPGEAPTAFPDTAKATEILRLAERTGVYRLAVGELARDFSLPAPFRRLPKETGEISLNVDGFVNNQYLLSVFGWACLPEISSEDDEVYLVVELPQGFLAYSGKSVGRSDVTGHFEKLTGRRMNYDNSGFIFRVAKSELPSVWHRLGVLIVAGKRRYLRWTAITGVNPV